MAVKPRIGDSTNDWGALQDAWDFVAHNADGSLKNLTYITDPAYGAIGDNGVTDNTAAIQAAINAVSAAGGGIVFIPPGDFGCVSALVPKSNVVLFGCGVVSHLFLTTTGNLIYGTTVSCSNFTVRGIRFSGPVNSFPTVPTRARTTSGAGTQTAIYIDGDLASPGNGVFTNFVIEDCIFENCSALPVLFRGVHGEMRVNRCRFTNNQDVGFVYCQSVEFSNNYIYGSADNGVSISRLNVKVVCSDNTFETCCYNGIWIAGFSTSLAPTNFTCVGNTIKSVGYNGIYLDYAPQYGTVVGNSIDCGYFRGPSDGPSDINGAGIYIGGYPPSNRPSPTSYALNLEIADNQIRTAARCGIYMNGVQASSISNNSIDDVGTQYLADNTTLVLSTDATQNIGILIENSSTTTNCTITHNRVRDSRGTPYCNYGIVPSTAGTGMTYFMNEMSGCRNAYNLVEQMNATRVFTNTFLFNANSKHVAGGTAGGNSQTGNVPGFDVNGAAGSVRAFRVLSGGVSRWYIRGNNTAESGSNAGTDLELNAYTDSGVLSSTPFVITRSSGLVTLQTHIATAGTAPSVAAGAQSASASLSRGTDIAGTVTSTAVASPAAGAIATITFANGYAATPNAIIITPTSSAAALAQLYISAISTTAFTVSSATASTNGATVSFSYMVVG